MYPAPLVAIIDDQEDLRHSLETLVEYTGYRSSLYASAEAFLERTDATDAQCIVSDVQMPGITGLELCRRLALAGDSTPIILISAFATAAMRRRALAAGAICLLPKPLDTAALIGILHRVLEPAS
ncbi:MAG: response regulator [Alphaproteobacteria bacterium]|nr:response regulator [Alphaproteobacteria bacterium]MBU0805413.1 response regulator [Alphaproteobacteria bacterium]MBU0873359.1 response regulator [Alphaproteobacteria bacterium]MBU1401413.1 response regulator [Alphaproteobacteria bacterium]MBU1592170.1 response regulator [Alphaproteobacteria bacterium]